MSAITFEVLDLNCEQANRNFFPPAVKLTAQSTTQIATVLGFPEYAGFTSTPPKKYHTITWEGSSEQDVFTDATLTTQIAGARFDWSGSSTIDSKGNYLTTYSKNLSEMCSAADGLCIGIADQVGAGFNRVYPIMGWMGAINSVFAVVSGCTLPGLPFTLQGDRAIKIGQPALYDSTPLSSGIDSKGNYISTFAVTSALTASDVSSGSQQIITIGLTAPLNKVSPFPCFNTGVAQGLQPISAQLTWNHNYSATLTDEYTDAEALANAVVIVGTATTAVNFPRTTGFVSTFTNVTFTLACSNLIIGQSYVVSVDLWDPATASTTTNTYPFTAVASTNTITDSIPTPAAGHSTQVRNQRITFA